MQPFAPDLPEFLVRIPIGHQSMQAPIFVVPSRELRSEVDGADGCWPEEAELKHRECISKSARVRVENACGASQTMRRGVVAAKAAVRRRIPSVPGVPKAGWWASWGAAGTGYRLSSLLGI